MSKLNKWVFAHWPVWALLAVLLLGLGLRLYALDHVPPGLFFDEAGKGLDAQSILRGEWPVFFPYSGGKEPLFMYLVAGLFLTPWVGQTAYAIRLASALCGTATLLTTYLLAREMFRTWSPLPAGEPLASLREAAHGQGGGDKRAQVIALLATLWLAVMYPAIHFSRVGFRAGSVALFETLAFWLFWRGWNAARDRASTRIAPAVWFTLSGAALGLCLYTYPTSRFVPFVLAAFVLVQMVRDRSRFAHHASHITLLAAVALLVFLPLGAYYITHWSEFTARAAQVSLFNPVLNHGDPLGTLAQNLLKTAGMFAVQGDPNWTHNLPGRPLLDPFTFILFVVGLLLCLWRSAGHCVWRRTTGQFLLLWFAIMLVPGLIAADLVPHFPRQTALLPAIAILAAYATVQIGIWLASRASHITSNAKRQTSNVMRAPYIWAIIVIIALVVITAINARDYFTVWATSEENYLAFDGHNVELAEYLNRLPADDRAYLLLIPAGYPSYIEGQPHRHLTIDFLYRGSAPHVYVPVSEAATPAQIAAVCRERRSPVAIEWTTREFLDADPKGLVRYLLGKYGVRTAIEPGHGWAASFFEVPNPPETFTIAETLHPRADNFGYQVALTGAAVGATVGAAGGPDVLTTTVPSGGNVWVAARWSKTAPVDADYSAFYYLRDAGGHLIAQASQALLDDNHQPVTRWQDGAENWGYAILPVWPGTPPGTYTVTVGLYDPVTFRRHGHFDESGQLLGTEAPVGTVTVVPPAAPLSPDAVGVSHPRLVYFDDVPGLELLGFELPVDTFAPGTTVPIALYWQATAPITTSVRVKLALLDGGGAVVATTGYPAGPDHPTNQWQVGETWYNWFDLRLPADAPPGDAMVTVSLVSPDGRETGLAPIVPLHIQGRPHSFDVPAIEQPFRATFGDRAGGTIELLGYEVTSSQSTIHLTLFWRCLAPVSTSYTVFTHLLDPTGQQRGQRDSIPCAGQCPTTSWFTGEVLTDTYDIPVDPGAPPGAYTIAVGWYDAGTGQRLPTGDTDHVT
ncbi:MAG: hypothetical protein KJ734_03870, partial [Chloroflexi bacterium]|nr:hypothetical protein [Chloroflexota bacterium]